MGDQKKIRGAEAKEEVARRVRERAEAALRDSDFSDVLKLMGAERDDGATSAAFKAVLADRMTDYAVRAMKEASRRGMKVGVASVIIAASDIPDDR